MLTRRHLLAGGAAALLGTTAAAALARPLGLQLYTIHDALERNFESALQTVAAIGYTAVESNLTLGGRNAAQLQRFFAGVGLTWRSAHCSGDELLSGLDATIDAARQAHLEFLVCAFPPIPGSFRQAILGIGVDDWKANAALFNRIGAAARAADLRFAYHNHNLEFRRYGDTTGYDILLAETDPELVKLELDCGWMASAGLDPVDYLRRYPGRYAMLHLKDLKPSHIPNTDLEMDGTEVGSGIIDWPRLLAAAADTGVQAMYVEQEPPFARSSLESAKISYEYLSTILK